MRSKILERIKRKCIFMCVKNKNTRNRLLQDISLEELRRDYGNLLITLKNSYADEPMEYSNKVWIFWRQGYEAAPPLIQACFQSVKKYLADREIIFLSEANLRDYIQLPEAIEQKRLRGVIPEAQYSDIIRISLLAQYGGIWLDSTVLCTGASFAEKMKQWPLFVYKLEDTDRSDENAIICSSWLISCYTNVPYIRATRDLLYAYWEKENEMKNYFLLHLFMHMGKDVYADAWKSIPVYNNVSPHILAFEMMDTYEKTRFLEIKKMSDFHKLNRHVCDGVEGGKKEKDSFYDKLIKGELD